jgi:tRNA pseudouridine55 synthase
MSRRDKPPASAFTGLLVLDKPIGLSSMEAASACRTKAGGRKAGIKVGHAGTLDPLADGVLVLAFGAATKHIDRIMALPKRYRTTFDLSAFTSSGDLEQDVQPVEVAQVPTCHDVSDAIEKFVGEISQRPPAFSALQIDGKRAYIHARAGIITELEPRTVTIHRIDVLRYDWPQVELDIRCGKGMYVRSLARDLGEALATGGHVTRLRRTAVGPFTDAMAVKLDDVPRPLLLNYLMPLESGLRLIEASID